MLYFLSLFAAIFAISIANETIKQLETIKESLDKQEKIFSKELQIAEAASKKKFEELAEKFKKFEEQCKSLDTLMRTKFDMPNLLTRLYPSKKFHMDYIYYKKTIDGFQKLDVRADSRLHQLHELGLHLNRIEKITNPDSGEMQMLVSLKQKNIQIRPLIEQYNKIGKAVQAVEKAFEKSFERKQNGKIALKFFAKKSSLENKCEKLNELVRERDNLPDKILIEHFKYVYFHCLEILQSHVTQEDIENFKKLLQEMKEVVGTTHSTEASELPENAKENMILETVDNLIETYKNIGKASAELKITLSECKQLYFHNDIKALIQIKYFADVVKFGEEFAENLKTYFDAGQPLDQKLALKKEKDAFVKQLISEIRYKDGDGVPDFICYASANVNSLDPNIRENKEQIFDRIERHSAVPEIEILNAEKETMESALQLLDIYKENIGAKHGKL